MPGNEHKTINREENHARSAIISSTTINRRVKKFSYNVLKYFRTQAGYMIKGAVYSAHLLPTRNYFTSIDKETHTLYIYKNV